MIRMPIADRRLLEEIAKRWISLWTCPVDWSLFDVLHADDFQDLAAAGRPATRDGFAAGIEAMTEAFPDLQTVVEDLVVDVERQTVAVRWTSRGTNMKSFVGTGPTGRVTVLRGIEIIEIREGRIARRWGEWDTSAHTDG